jgi:hypothetical protein
MQYTVSNAGPRISIRPDDKRLMSIWKGGGEIQLTDEEKDHAIAPLWQGNPLTLILVVRNRSPAPLQVTGVDLAVQASDTDLQPAIQLGTTDPEKAKSDSDEGICGRYTPRIALWNYGWGSAEQSVLQFAFARGTGPRPTTFNLSKRVGRIVREVTVDLEPELRNAGVNTNLLRRGRAHGMSCSSPSLPACLQQLKNAGIFGSIGQYVTLGSLAGALDEDGPFFLNAVGRLSYTWTDSNQAQKNASSPFDVKMPLGLLKGRGCAEGGQREPITRSGLTFKLDQSNYRLPVTLRRSISPGATSRFTMSLKADKSSKHEFRVIIKLADGREISSRPINLLYYWPKRTSEL